MLMSFRRDAMLFCIGGVTYGLIEIIWRQRTHWSMVLAGGVCFLALYKVYNRYPSLSMPEKCVVGSLIITAVEFYIGCIVNIWLRWDVWDYSGLPLNLLGQVCLLYSVLWGLLCVPMSHICKRIRIKTA